MLVLSRKQDQAVFIGENIKVTVVKVQGNSIRLGIEAPEDVRVLRGELAEWHELPVDAAGLSESLSSIRSLEATGKKSTAGMAVQGRRSPTRP